MNGNIAGRKLDLCSILYACVLETVHDAKKHLDEAIDLYGWEDTGVEWKNTAAQTIAKRESYRPSIHDILLIKIT